MDTSEIQTTYDPPPIPIREKEAIDDLEQQLADIQDDQP